MILTCSIQMKRLKYNDYQCRRMITTTPNSNHQFNNQSSEHYLHERRVKNIVIRNKFIDKSHKP